jgi:hypothetical protein
MTTAPVIPVRRCQAAGRIGRSAERASASACAASLRQDDRISRILRAQQFGHLRAQRFGARGRPRTSALACACRPAWRPWRAGASGAFHGGVRGQRHLAAAAKYFDTLRSAVTACAVGFVVQRRQHRHQVEAVVRSAISIAIAPWPGGRQAVPAPAARGCARQAQALEAGGGQDDGGVIATVQLAQTGIEIAAQRLDHQMRVARRDQRLAAQAAGADHAPAGSSSSEA